MRILKYILGATFLACIPFTVSAQFMFGGGGNRAAQDSLRKIAAADYADMLAKVGVGEPREGRQPNNPDESKHPGFSEMSVFYGFRHEVEGYGRVVSRSIKRQRRNQR